MKFLCMKLSGTFVCSRSGPMASCVHFTLWAGLPEFDSQHVQEIFLVATGSRVHPTSRGHYHGVKRTWHVADHSPLSRAKVNNELHLNSRYVFMT
jgi:hypothetical protein